MSAEKTMTIVVNNYNNERFIESAVRSALTQREVSVQVVVVDDGSTDGSLAVLARYGGDVELIAKTNGGQTSALNVGFARAEGSVVCFLDSDDSLLPDASSRAVEMMADEHVARAVWRLERVNPRGEVLGMVPEWEVAQGEVRPLLFESDFSPLIAPTSCNAWSRAFLDTVFPLPEIEPLVGYGSAMADLLMASCAALYGTTATTTEVLGRYTQHEANDFARRTVWEQLRMHEAILPHHFRRLEAYARERGVELDAHSAHERFFWSRLRRALETIASAVAPGSTTVIIDDGWRVDVGAPFPALPFIERNGDWWGTPDDDQAAVAELANMEDRGARAVAVLWPSFWWFDYYPTFFARIRETHVEVAANDDLVLFISNRN